MDKFIQDAQLNANYPREIIEWIPYDRFKDVKQIGRGGFGTIHYSRWIDGQITRWDIINKQCHKCHGNSLKNMAIHLKMQNEGASIKFYGITQDPETHSYSMILEDASEGNLREYLKINLIGD
ncbi:hypothetical protein Glove_420g64 [Diversispora epigaea]|uniref:Protein kinase domain-containing protein n=1 Tax=Diversispora epigaea TaxID=1348612 RepID=A0A397H085_9GLOM|nr:hypothetical protein Glove_420g64 [Diversispora epigaea]